VKQKVSQQSTEIEGLKQQIAELQKLTEELKKRDYETILKLAQKDKIS